MSRPRNDTSYWNRLDGRKPEPLPHVIAAISMRDDAEPINPDRENHVSCRCGWETTARTAEALATKYAAHHFSATGRTA